jgi:beta-lactamase regulating signal transducer with metallopeptidase domain
LNEWAAAWAPTFVGLVWQSTLLVVVVAVACWALRRHSPALRFGLLLLLAAKLLVLPIWTVVIETPAWLTAEPAAAPVAASPARIEAAPVSDAAAFEDVSPSGGGIRPNANVADANPRSIHQRERLTWQAWLLSIWLVVVAAEVVRTLWQFRRLRRLLAGAKPVTPHIALAVAECARALRLRAVPSTVQVDADGSPLACGLLNPTLVFPAAMLGSFDSPALRQIILHELAHIRRRDLWTIWIIHVMRTIYWFHPAAYWTACRAGLERELACDQLAMTHSGASAGAYARTLIRAVGARSQPIVLTAAAAARLDGGQSRFTRVDEAASFARQ